MITAAALAGSAVLIGLAGLIAPVNDGEAAALYDAASSAPGRLTVEAAVLVVSSVLLVVAVIGAARVVRGRGRRLALAAALFGVMGALGHVAYDLLSHHD
jgi:heme/copper-type cytochrome/quinol oxidase subunit 3